MYSIRLTKIIPYSLSSNPKRLGNVEKAYILDDYAEGKDTGIIDLLLVGEIDQYHLNDLSRKTERYIKRKIRTLVLSKEEYKEFVPSIQGRSRLLLWKEALGNSQKSEKSK